MNQKSIEGRIADLKTTGVGVFGASLSGTCSENLFRVEPGHSADFVLEQATMLMAYVNKLTLHVMFEQDEAMLCAAHYLSGMAKALVEDVAHGMVVGCSAGDSKAG
ncbi:DUF3077 domain-containing protein [Pseudomonas sp. UM16]|uniref:DUF3077 domain-containing protein n=1 Tax=Pseudomonas sp. UM16 TaxID=3158962 RepID=UPI00398FFFEF